MGASIVTSQGKLQGLRASALRKPVSLRFRGARLLVDADGTVRSYDSFNERRSIFGQERLLVYKVQAGVLVQAQHTDWSCRVSPRSAQFDARVFQAVDSTQKLEFFPGPSLGYVRTARLKNSGTSPIKVRLICLVDPTCAQLGEGPGRWGSLGVNAFNRGSHVAMDEVSEPPSARVVGTAPAPARFYMTTDRARALELAAAGDLPEAVSGTSGQVLILSLHDLDLSPGETKEVVYAFLYNPERLEVALSDFGRMGAAAKPESESPLIACSSAVVTEASSWAMSVLEASRFTKDGLDRYETLKALSLVGPAEADLMIEDAARAIRRDGAVPHALDPSQPGLLETAILLQGTAFRLHAGRDKKASRKLYPLVRRLALFLMAASSEYSVPTDPRLPQGWRRHLGRGHPTGEIPEVSLAAADGLAEAARVAGHLSKQADASRFRERAEMITENVKKRLVDERGYLSLCLDPSGRLHTDETIDMVVAAYRRPSLASVAMASVHRLLEKDFETPYGPRTVPVSLSVYFNRTYGRGELGGFWTRAALAHALLCYRSGLPGMGGLELTKVARLAVVDSVRLGGAPGELPYWVDVEGAESHGDDSDPVAAARFVECLLEGEVGLSLAADRASASPPPASSLKWILAAGLTLAGRATVFVGRSAGKALAFESGGLESSEGTKFAKSELLGLPAGGAFGVSFYGPGQVVVLANSTPAPARVAVSFAPRAEELAKRLTTPLEAYDQAKSSWAKVGSLRVAPSMSFDATLGPNDWKAFRISTP
jgi:hypothetical protein